MGKIIDIELAGRRVWFAERTARQALAFTEYVNPSDDENDEADKFPPYYKAIHSNAIIIRDAAIAYNSTLPKWNFWRRFWQANSTKPTRLISKVGALTLGKLALEILIQCEEFDPEADTINIKKKIKSPSA